MSLLRASFMCVWRPRPWNCGWVVLLCLHLISLHMTLPPATNLAEMLANRRAATVGSGQKVGPHTKPRQIVFDFRLLLRMWILIGSRPAWNGGHHIASLDIEPYRTCVCPSLKMISWLWCLSGFPNWPHLRVTHRYSYPWYQSIYILVITAIGIRHYWFANRFGYLKYGSWVFLLNYANQISFQRICCCLYPPSARKLCRNKIKNHNFYDINKPWWKTW